MYVKSDLKDEDASIKKSRKQSERQNKKCTETTVVAHFFPPLNVCSPSLRAQSPGSLQPAYHRHPLHRTAYSPLPDIRPGSVPKAACTPLGSLH